MKPGDVFDCEGCQKDFDGGDEECAACIEQWMEKCHQCKDQSLCERCFFKCEDCAGCDGCNGEGDPNDPKCEDCMGCDGCVGCEQCELQECLEEVEKLLHDEDEVDEFAEQEEAELGDDLFAKMAFIVDGGRRPLSEAEQHMAKTVVDFMQMLFMDDELLEMLAPELAILKSQIAQGNTTVCEMFWMEDDN